MNKNKLRLTPFQQNIIEIAQDEGFVTINSIYHRYNVTKWTIRMNVKKLEKNGYIKRTENRGQEIQYQTA